MKDQTGYDTPSGWGIDGPRPVREVLRVRVEIDFDPHTDPMGARQVVREVLDNLSVSGSFIDWREDAAGLAPVDPPVAEEWATCWHCGEVLAHPADDPEAWVCMFCGEYPASPVLRSGGPVEAPGSPQERRTGLQVVPSPPQGDEEL